jgi:hypothetical protein
MAQLLTTLRIPYLLFPAPPSNSESPGPQWTHCLCDRIVVVLVYSSSRIVLYRYYQIDNVGVILHYVRPIAYSLHSTPLTIDQEQNEDKPTLSCTTLISSEIKCHGHMNHPASV